MGLNDFMRLYASRPLSHGVDISDEPVYIHPPAVRLYRAQTAQPEPSISALYALLVAATSQTMDGPGAISFTLRLDDDPHSPKIHFTRSAPRRPDKR